MNHRADRHPCSGIFLMACLAITFLPAASAHSTRRGVQRVALGSRRAFAPSSEASFRFSFPSTRVQFTLLRADMGELIQTLLGTNSGRIDLSDAPVVRSWTETPDAANPGSFNRQVTFTAPEPGVYVLEVRWGERPEQVQYEAFVSTDMALLVKRGSSRMAVWVVNRRTGEPMPGALVHARFPKSAAVEARGDSHGLAMVPLAGNERQSQLCVVSAQAGKQWAAAQIANPGMPPSAQDRAFVWLNAAQIGPGDPWRLRGIARNRSGRPLAVADVRMRILNPENKVVHERQVRTDTFGCFEDGGILDEGLAPGVYRVVAEFAGQQAATGFVLAPPQAQAFRVRLQPGAGGEAGGTIALDARELLGEPVRLASVRYWIYPAFRVAEPTPELARHAWLTGDPPVQLQVWNPLQGGRALTDRRGAAALQLERGRVPAGQAYLLVASVTDRYGRSVSADLYSAGNGAAVPPPAPPVGRIRGGGRRPPAPARAAAPADPALAMTPGQEEYQLGDTARLDLDCKLPSAHALLCLEGEDLYHAQVLSLRQGAQQVRIPLADARMRLVHADLIALAPDGSAHRAARLILVQPARTSLQVTPTLNAARPGELLVDVQTTDAQGRPVPARIFADLEPVAGGNLPQPYGWDVRRALFPPEPNSVLTQGEAWGLATLDLVPWLRYAAAPGLAAAVLSGPGTAPRLAARDIRSPILTDRRGKGRIRLAYDGPLSGMRLIVRAAAESGAVGQADATLAPSSAITVRLRAPARLFSGDFATARAEIENQTDRVQTVSLRWSGEGLQTPGVQPALLPVGPGSRSWFDIPMRAMQTGRYLLRASIEAGRTRSSDAASIAVVENMMVAGDLTPSRRLRRFTIGSAGPSGTPFTGSVSPGEEIEVRISVPARDREPRFRVVEPLSGAFSLVDVEAPEGARARQTATGLEFSWPQAPRAAIETITYRLRAMAPGEFSLGRTAVYQDGSPLGTAGALRVAVAPLPAPRLIVAERAGERLRLRYEIRKDFGGRLAATLAVRIQDRQGGVLAEARVPVKFERMDDPAREVAVETPLIEPARVRGAVVHAVLEGSGALAMGGVEVPLARIESRSESRLSTALGQTVTRVLGQSDLIAGAPASLRVIALNSREALPVEGAAVRIRFQPKQGGNQAAVLAQGRTDASGTLNARFVVPEDTRGAGQLLVECSSILGQETVAREVRIEDRLQMLLSTDKPIYQPAQVIHIRSLTLRKPDLKPLSSAPVTLEVSDPKGNKVFKQRKQTDEFGVAAAEFQLAEEINMGSYVLRAIVQPPAGPALTVEKTLEIKRYVLPKFRIELSTDRPYYMPGERLKGTMKVIYFFGKPVANGTVEVKLSTFVTRVEQIAAIQGKTNAQGEFTFDQDLPQMFVGQPLQKGNAMLLLEAAVVDSANHRETHAHSVTVAANPIDVALIPESGILAPNLENRMYLVASYPDGRPVPRARFRVDGPGLPDAGVEGRADERGMAEVMLTPGPAAPGTAGLKLRVEAADEKGNRSREEVTVRADSRQEALLLRADRAIYEVGQQARLDVLSTLPRGSVYLDVVRNRQTVLTQTLELRDGRGSLVVPMGEDTSGTIEFRAYRILPSGEMLRDTRIAYVNPANDLVIRARPQKDVYTPGAPASISFEVNDRQGHPVMAALGVNIVDESVFALQELQPGLEKVYFTLEKELLEPRYEIHWTSPGLGVFEDPARDARGAPPDEGRQSLARVMFAAVEMAHDYSLSVNTQDDRAQVARQRAEHIRDAIQNAIQGGQVAADREAYFSRHHDLPEVREGLAFYAGTGRALKPEETMDPWDQPYVLRFDGPDPSRQQVLFEVVSPGPDGELDTADDTAVEGAVYLWSYVPGSARQWAAGRLRSGALLAQGLMSAREQQLLYFFGDLGVGDRELAALQARSGGGGFGGGLGGGGLGGLDVMNALGRPAAGMAGGALREERLMLEALGEQGEAHARRGIDGPRPSDGDAAKAGGPPKAGEPEVKPARVREFFPETLYSNPALVTDAGGKAKIDLQLADSITTWRITALGSSRTGQLGNVSAPLRVFQDFFVDLDLPVSLTQNDEVQLPVAVYNYLPGPQRVRLHLLLGDETNDQRPAGSPAPTPNAQHPTPTPWFEMVGGDATEKFLNLEKDQVSVVTFRIRARDPGVHHFTVMAYGTRFSDAIRRQIEVVPDGKEIRDTVNDRLEKTTAASITIPPSAIPGSAKVLVKIYPGVFSQVVEGLDGMFRMPYG